MEKEEKQVDKLLEEGKDKLANMTFNVGNMIRSTSGIDGVPNYPDLLTSFFIVSSNITAFHKYLNQPYLPNLKTRSCLPLEVNPEKDETIAKMTDNRVQFFNHETVPNYLRTKLEPEMENLERQYQVKASTISPDQGQKQVAQVNKIVASMTDLCKSMKEEWETQTAKRPISFRKEDTLALLSAVQSGKGIKPGSIPDNKATPPPATPAPKGPGKAPSGIKTNIKTNTHPYSRN